MRIEKASRHRGFTLIEVLVALLVLSVGLLGTAAMQLQSLQGAHAAYQRSIASLAAQDAQERLWAEVAEIPGVPPCPTSELGNVQSAWRTHWTDSGNVTVVLPGFSQSTIQQSGDDCKFIITVGWDEQRFGGSEETFTYTVRLPETPE